MSAAGVDSSWFTVGGPGADAPMRLFCLPYAVGNASLFRHWQAELGSTVGVLAPRLPGRLDRLDEPAIPGARALAAAVARAMTPLLDRPYALFGVSMGGLVAFEVARALTPLGQPPARLFVASCRAPREPADLWSVHRMAPRDLVAALRRIGTAPPDLLDDEELVRTMLPTIRADFAVTETYRYAENTPLPVPITVIRGDRDRTTAEREVRRWSAESSRDVEFHELPGGHFFAAENPRPLLALLRDRLAEIAGTAPRTGGSPMTGIDQRLGALSPSQRRLLEQRLKSARPTTPPPVRARPRRHGLKWSLFFFASADTTDVAEHYRLVTECARFADSHGFEAIWFPERHFDPFGAPFPSPAVLAGAVAAITERLGVRAGSVVLPLHDPLRVAEDWAVVDVLSGGRAGVSFASGWHANDFVLAPDVYDARKKVLLAKLADVRRLWAGEPVRRIDGTGKLIDVHAYPVPPRRGLPQWITSSSRVDTWLTGAREGMNVLTGLMEQTVDQVAEKVAAYRAELATVGRSDDDREVTLMAHTFVGADPAEVRAVVYDPLVAYLRSHIELFAKLARSSDVGIDVDRVTEADKEALAAMAFDRYFSTHGLFGTPQTALPMIERFAAAGVTEVACLVDFGIAPDTVLANLVHLDRLRTLAAAEAEAG